ncbi:hypothetical protein M426DRAFT_246141 [Hypoxylon sp. CI-4A]|nr:hypothetical protein M426DRAFT_246141 [Hypoxylon sp. CI-4A]
MVISSCPAPKRSCQGYAYAHLCRASGNCQDHSTPCSIARRIPAKYYIDPGASLFEPLPIISLLFSDGWSLNGSEGDRRREALEFRNARSRSYPIKSVPQPFPSYFSFILFFQTPSVLPFCSSASNCSKSHFRVEAMFGNRPISIGWVLSLPPFYSGGALHRKITALRLRQPVNALLPIARSKSDVD